MSLPLGDKVNNCNSLAELDRINFYITDENYMGRTVSISAEGYSGTVPVEIVNEKFQQLHHGEASRTGEFLEKFRKFSGAKPEGV